MLTPVLALYVRLEHGWFKLIRDSPVWPIKGRYQCRCLRYHPVPWDISSTDHRPAPGSGPDSGDCSVALGEAMLKSRENDAGDEEIKRLKSVVAGVCVDNE